jgi:hypothetical protein
VCICQLRGEQYIQNYKGLRQGDPLSPLLFNLVGDVLNRMLTRAYDKGLIKGLMRNFRPESILTLQYADDTLLFASSEDDCIRNLKVVLMLFEKVLARAHELAHLLSCPLWELPFSYLGLPIHFEMLKREDLQSILDKLIKRIAGWRQASSL